jgi:hypothetical protein
MGNQRFSITPARSVGDHSLTDGEYRTLAAYGLHGDKNGWSFPGDRTIAEIRGISRRTVIRHRRKLIALGYINTIPRYNESGAQATNYTQIKFDFSTPEEPKDPEEEPEEPEEEDTPPVTSRSHTPRDTQSHTPRDTKSHTINDSVNASDNTPINKDAYSFPFDTGKETPLMEISQPAPGRAIMEAVLFPLMPNASEYWPTINGAAYKFGHEETKNALKLAFGEWIQTKNKKGKRYNPHNYNWIQWGIEYLETGKQSWLENKESNNGSKKPTKREYTSEDRRIAANITAGD